MMPTYSLNSDDIVCVAPKSIVGIERCLVGPRLDEGEYIGARGALEYVIGNHASVALRLGNQGDGCLQGAVVLTLFRLEKTIQSNHNNSVNF